MPGEKSTQRVDQVLAAGVESFSRWICAEISTFPGIKKADALEMLQQGKLALLFDGLDEFSDDRRAELSVVINAFVKEHGDLPITICSRTNEYAALRSDSRTILRLNKCAEIQPLTKTQISNYLEAAKASELTQYYPELFTGDNLACTPLTLSMLVHSYVEAHRQNPQPKEASTAERRHILFSSYVKSMIKRRERRGNIAGSPAPNAYANSYGAEKIGAWLGWLACLLSVRSITAFNASNLHDLLTKRLELDPSRSNIFAFILPRAIFLACCILFSGLIAHGISHWKLTLQVSAIVLTGIPIFANARYGLCTKHLSLPLLILLFYSMLVPFVLGDESVGNALFLVATGAFAIFKGRSAPQDEKRSDMKRVDAMLEPITFLFIPFCLGNAIELVATCFGVHKVAVAFALLLIIISGIHFADEGVQLRSALCATACGGILIIVIGERNLWFGIGSPVLCLVGFLALYSVGLFVLLEKVEFLDWESPSEGIAKISSKRVKRFVSFILFIAAFAQGSTTPYPAAVGLGWFLVFVCVYCSRVGAFGFNLTLAVCCAYSLGTIAHSSQLGCLLMLLFLIGVFLLSLTEKDPLQSLWFPRPNTRGERLFSALSWLISSCGRRFPFFKHRFITYCQDALLLKRSVGPGRSNTSIQFEHRMLRDFFALQALRPSLRSKSIEVRLATIGALGYQGESSIEFLEDLAQDDDPSIKAAALAALGRISSPDIARILHLHLNEENPRVRASLIASIFSLPREAGVDLLRRFRKHLLSSDVPALLQGAKTIFDDDVRSLLECEQRYVREVTEGLNDPHPLVRVMAIRLLESWEDPECVRSLVPLLRDKVADIRVLVASALGSIASIEAVPGLIDCLSSWNSALRVAAAEALGSIGDPRALPALKRCLRDVNDEVREAAEESIDEILDDCSHGEDGNFEPAGLSRGSNLYPKLIWTAVLVMLAGALSWALFVVYSR